MNRDLELEHYYNTFDFKRFLFKLLGNWVFFVLTLGIAFGIAYYISVRNVSVYQLQNMIAIEEEEQNAFLASTSNAPFNWGGTTNKVNTAIITLRSRTHNEKVVNKLQYYITYLKQGIYQLEDAYRETPLVFIADEASNMMLDRLIKVTLIDSTSLNVQFSNEANRVFVQHTATKKKRFVKIENQNFNQDFDINEPINLPFLSGVFKRSGLPLEIGTSFYLKFLNFDSVVSQYRGVSVRVESKGSSIFILTLRGTNKTKIVDYLNTSVQTLSDDMLASKNLFATKTIDFINELLSEKSEELSGIEDELNAFRNKTEVLDLTDRAKEINVKLSLLDTQKETITNTKNYYEVLEQYLSNRVDYSNIPAPSVVGISESSIGAGVSKIVDLGERRKNFEYSFKENAPVFADIDRQINTVKSGLIENIKSSKGLINSELQIVNQNIINFEAKLRKLPSNQQELIHIQRRYNLSETTYNLFLEKLSEAGLLKAANVSDVVIIDEAKDIGGGKIGPNTQLNYVIAGIFGFSIPFITIFILVFFDNKIYTNQEINKLSPAPILGVIGKNNSNSNLAVLNNPKSLISESFRALRSNLQFLYKEKLIKGAKTVLITSSISGEGKTFCSINLASVFSLSDKRTVLVGLDFRKPKIFEDFDIDNSFGVVNYLINDKSLAEITQETQYPYIDVILSGPIPPNPSELLMSDRMEEFMEELKLRYDYIILDSPPLGLVADALELIKYADTTLFVVRQKFTKKGMLNLLNKNFKLNEMTNISIVMNYFQHKAKYGYGYGYGYGFGYAYRDKSYGTSDEDTSQKGIIKRLASFFKPN